MAARPLLLSVLLLASASAELLGRLPGAPAVNFKQYAGYFKVSPIHQMHYWFVESANNASSDPLLLWLTGGPGCSGFSALLTEFGPLIVDNSGQTLHANPYSWNKLANILVIESPAGVGYSYSTNGDVGTNDQKVADENYEALKQFFAAFPQYRDHDFYVTGESYGGIYVPTLVQTILDGQSSYHMNLKGMVVGNGCVSVNLGFDTIIEFVYGHGMVDENTWKRGSEKCCGNNIEFCPFHTFEGGYCEAFANDLASLQWASGMNPYNMYAYCDPNANAAVKPMQKRFMHEYKMFTGKAPPPSQASVPCLDETPVTTYMNLPAVRKALFVPDKLGPWAICSDTVGEVYDRIYHDMTSRAQNAINAGLRVLIYNGDIDMACNFLMGQRFSQRLGFAQTSAKRVFQVGGQVGGFHTQYGNLEFETVVGAGHMVPTDKPAVALHIMRAFLNKKQP